jgi:hypothetical protein
MEGVAVENHEVYRNQPVNLLLFQPAKKYLQNYPSFFANFLPSGMTLFTIPFWIE